nr:Ig-like domain-containing protein [Solitalea agri]
MFLKKKIEALIVTTLFFTACANIVSPTGGDKDVTPPKLLSETPKNKSLNFSGKKIEIEFDEVVQLKDQFKEISVTPEMELAPEISARKNIILVKLIDTLRKNTTYSINFGNSIADMNESNLFKNYRYVFSTGNYIDSLKIAGTVDYVIDTALTKDVIIGLFPPNLEALYKQKPIIYTSTGTGGKFELNNIKNGEYRIYAIKDLNGNKRYDEDELLGFLDKPINLQKDSLNLNFTISKQIPRKTKVTETKYYEGKILVKYNRKDDSVNYNVLYPEEFKNKIITDKSSLDSVSLWVPTAKFDSTKIEVLKNGKPFDTVLIRNFIKEPKFSLTKITDNLKSTVLKPGDTIKLNFSRPLQNPDFSKIEVLEDSIKKTNFSVIPNIHNIKEYAVKYNWDSTKNYEINIKENTFTDIYGKGNSDYKRKFVIDSIGNYGTILTDFEIPEGKQYIVELLDENNVVLKHQIISSSGIYPFTVLVPDRYKLRYIEDSNKNNQWDVGKVDQNIQPEPIYYFKDEIAVRIGWEIEVKINAK